MAKDSHEEIYENVQTISNERKEKTSITCSSRLSCLWIISFLLVGSIVANIWMCLQMYQQKATSQELEMKMGKLQNYSEELEMKMGKLQNHSEVLTHENNDLNLWLNFFLKFKNVQVSNYCSGEKCRPCQEGWVEFQKKCYLFIDEQPWKTWKQSDEHCKSKSADLVTIDHLQEQEFLSKQIKSYYDEYHGFWLGLREINNRWVWTDGRNDTLGFWMGSVYGPSGPFALLIPGKTPTNSWDTSDNGFLNKFICEQEALVKLEARAR
ncbi:C-type lectin domain family 12 member B-like [Poecilia latipinna]|nr:PREDICTED: C-type lectin domain family 12 member B-like [Poecilia latipinna]